MMSDQAFERLRADWRQNIHRVIQGRDTLWYPDGWITKDLEPLAMEPFQAADVVRATCEVFGIEPCVFTGHGRNKRMDMIRQIAVLIMRQRCGKSYPQLGVVMNRDQSSCRHNHLLALKRVAVDPEFRAMRNKVLERL